MPGERDVRANLHVTFVPLERSMLGHGKHMDEKAAELGQEAELSSPPDRVIVGVDGSPPSIAALRYAARIADAFDAPLEAITTWTFPPLADAYALSGWSPESDASDLLDAAVAEAFASNPPPIERTIVPGPPAGTLIGISRRAGMLVLGNRGHGGFAGLLLGSVSTACAAHAKCPVLIVHAGSAVPTLPRPVPGSESD